MAYLVFSDKQFISDKLNVSDINVLMELFSNFSSSDFKNLITAFLQPCILKLFSSLPF